MEKKVIVSEKSPAAIGPYSQAMALYTHLELSV